MNQGFDNYVDISGKRFGKWSVIRSCDTVNKILTWECQCDCGVTRVVSGGKLRQGTSQSCGCSNAKDVTGNTYGTWKAIKIVRDHNGLIKWLCRDGDSHMLFTRSELLHNPPPQPVSDFLSSKENKDSKRYGTWKVVAKVNELKKNGKKSWKVAYESGADGFVVAQCQKSKWVGVFRESEMDNANPPKYPAPKKVKMPKKAHDLTGVTFGPLTAIERVGTTDTTRLAVWKCKCKDCGVEKELSSMLLKRTKICTNCTRIKRQQDKLSGFSEEEIAEWNRRKDETLEKLKEKFCGNTFGTWRVNEYAGRDKWSCVCVTCGIERSYSTTHIQREPECQCTAVETDTVCGAYLIRGSSGHTDSGTPRWECECTVCGDVRDYVASTLMKGPECNECGNKGIPVVVEEEESQCDRN